MEPIIPGALMRKEDFIGMISSELQDFCLIVIDEEFYKRGFTIGYGQTISHIVLCPYTDITQKTRKQWSDCFRNWRKRS